ncbi:MAG: hypothetical protein WA751_06220 [Candidatus Dormiibacterota bacterium]
MSIRLVEMLRARGHQVTELIGDRGFSQDPSWMAGLREEDVMGIFDLKSTQMRSYPSWRGCLVLPSGVYLPTLPERLRLIERPGPQAPKEKRATYLEAIKERSLYAMVAHGKATPDQVRLSSPVLRRKTKSALGCPKVPVSMRRRDPRLAVCDGCHGDDEACCIATATLKAEEIPSIYQFPFWGTPDWEEKYAKRTNVERGFSSLKNPDVIGLTKGQFHLRHIPNMSLLVTLMWGAHNMRLQMTRARDLAREGAALLRKQQRRPRRSSQVPFAFAPPDALLAEEAAADGSRSP